MADSRTEENRYCPTCMKKTFHWVTRIASGVASESMRDQPVKTECRICKTVDER